MRWVRLQGRVVVGQCRLEIAALRKADREIVRCLGVGRLHLHDLSEDPLRFGASTLAKPAERKRKRLVDGHGVAGGGHG